MRRGRYTISHHTGHARGDHYDLFLEDGDALRTWALVIVSWRVRVPARQGAPHRLAYLDYEGPVSRGRGEIERIETGRYEASVWTAREVVATLDPSDAPLRRLRLACRAARPREGSKWTVEPAYPARVAAIDIGSNSVKLLIARWESGRLHPCLDRIWLPRLGEGAFRTGRLSAAAQARTLAALREARREIAARGIDRVVAAATEAVRRAANGRAFLARARRTLGVDVRLLSPRDEARLAFRGATADLAARRVVAVDIGGGSTEVMAGPPGRLRSCRSLRLGCVRILESGRRPCITAALPHARELVGIGGTVATILRMLRGPRAAWDRLDRRRLGRAEIERLAARLASLPVARRARLPGLDPARADIILPGAWILLKVMKRMGARTLMARTRGLRHGLAIEMARAALC